MANWREMPSKRFKAEEIIRKLREAEVEQAHGRTVPQACKKIGVQEDRCRGADVLSLAEGLRWPSHRPGEAVQRAGEGEHLSEEAAG